MTAAATLSTTLALRRAAHTALPQGALGGHGREPLVPGLDGHLDNASQRLDFGPGTPRCWAVGAGQAARHPDDHELDLFLTGEGGDVTVVLAAVATTPDHREG